MGAGCLIPLRHQGILGAGIPVIAAVLGAGLDSLLLTGAGRAVAVTAVPAIDGAGVVGLALVAEAIATVGRTIVGTRLVVFPDFAYVVTARQMCAILGAQERVLTGIAVEIAARVFAAILRAGIRVFAALIPLALAIPAAAAAVDAAGGPVLARGTHLVSALTAVGRAGVQRFAALICNRVAVAVAADTTILRAKRLVLTAGHVAEGVAALTAIFFAQVVSQFMLANGRVADSIAAFSTILGTVVAILIAFRTADVIAAGCHLTGHGRGSVQDLHQVRRGQETLLCRINLPLRIRCPGSESGRET